MNAISVIILIGLCGLGLSMTLTVVFAIATVTLEGECYSDTLWVECELVIE